jgi:N-acetylmuramoyl-L-alanine amidase
MVTVAEIKRLLELDVDFDVTVVNQDDNGLGLEGVGKATKDYDLAIAIHYNAADNVEHGSEVLVTPKANAETKQFASLLCAEIVAILDTKSRGVKEKSLSIFTGFKKIKNNKCIFVLSEGHFIDDEVDALLCRKKSILNAEAHVIAIKKWYKKS